MKYDEIKVHQIDSVETQKQAQELMREEFHIHTDTDLTKEYEWVLVATKKSNVIGVITANKYVPKRALLCDIVVEDNHRSKGVAIKLLKHMFCLLRDVGYTHILGFTDMDNTGALNTYTRVGAIQQKMIVSAAQFDISIPHTEQLELRLEAMEMRRKRK